MPRLLALFALALALIAAGCGSDDESDPEPVVQTTTVTETTEPTTTEPETTTAPETETEPELTTPEDNGGGCTDPSGNTIKIISGDVTCDAAKATASQYDPQGPRVQELSEWICEGGNAQTRPVIFTCSGPGGEFTVSEAGG